MKMLKSTILIFLAMIQANCQSLASRAPAQEALTVQSYTASDQGFDVNSHLIMGRKEAILVDAQFTRSEARKVADMVRFSGRDLKTIFITHGHPDHYLGLEILTRQFPRARILATPEVIADIKATAPAKLSYWKPIYKDDLADNFFLPEPLMNDFVTLEGEKIQVIKIGPGESENSAVLYIPSLRILVSGDLTYSQVHLWLAENRPEEWLRNLNAIQNVGPIERVLPGHGPAGTFELLHENAQYIENFVKITDGKLKKEAALKALEGLYPQFKLPVIADLSISARVK